MTSFAGFAGLSVDRIAGEPPVSVHPVVGFGSLMTRLEHRIYADRRRNGVMMLVAGSGIAIGAGVALRRLFGPFAATVVATAVCAAGAMLDDEAISMAVLLRDEELPRARERLRSLVGRQTDELDVAAMCRAVIESVAENSVDAVTSSLLWACVAGAPGVLAHRAINTLDAMVGHHDDRYERFGWASARADDFVNFLPARATALAVVVARPRRCRAVWSAVRRDAAQHPSPNGGVIEAAYAGALGVRLGGVNRYGDRLEDRGALGSGTPPSVDDIMRAVRLRRSSTTVLAATAMVVDTVARRVRRRRSR